MQIIYQNEALEKKMSRLFEVTRGQKSQKRSKLRLFEKNSNYTSKWGS